ncbi:hypothetical protein RR48_00794 [Papilio machaon]|uniref:Uncharacterized protein n=1 Tax=Papilio machaon TaxID=76193 RepID=A0A0N0PDP3_PAPMA|nr:hypothetical protein RR48_00794 [Papilio machaon]
MKFAIFFVLCFVAFALLPLELTWWPGFVAPYAPLAPRTVVAGPTVVNGLGWGGRFIAPGVVGATVI